MVELLNIFCLHYPPVLSLYVLTLHRGSQPVIYSVSGIPCPVVCTQVFQETEKAWAIDNVLSERGQRHKWPRSKQLKKMQEVLRCRNREKWKVRIYIYNLPQKESGTFMDSRSQSFTCDFVICICKYECVQVSLTYLFNLLSHLPSPLPPNYIHIYT